MTPDQKAAIAAAAEAEKNGTTAEPVNAEDPAEEPIEGEEAEEAQDPAPSTPDYEAIAKAESDRADAAERAAAEEAFKAREARRGKGSKPDLDPEDDEDEDTPLTRGEFEERLARERQTMEKKAAESAALSIARANTATEAEAQAAMQFYMTRVVPTGNLEEDVLFAIGGLNHRRSAARASELGRALQSKETARRTTGEPHRDTTPQNEPKMSPADSTALKEMGVVWDGKMRLYKKPLGNGSKHFYYDPKSKRRWTA